MPMLRTAALIALAITWALLPWWLLLAVLRAGLRHFRPSRVRRYSRVPLTRPARPVAALLVLVLAGLAVAGWAAYTRPLWSAYAADAWAYRRSGAAAAAGISAELMALGQPLGPARVGRTYVNYSLAAHGETVRANVAFHWAETQVEPEPGSPVEVVTTEAHGGAYALTYRRDLDASQFAAIRGAFERITAAGQPPKRRPGVDVPVLLRSVPQYWQGYFGQMDTLAGVARAAAGLPALPLLYVVGLVVGGLPGR
jgi:hypothetical protein